jgi:hypothetical protein
MSLWYDGNFFIDVNSVLWLLHHVVVGDVDVDVSEVHAASIFKVGMYGLMSSCVCMLHKFSCPPLLLA